MATQFNIPSSPKKLVYQSDNFLGADFTSEASTVDDTKSPNCENMIRSVPGKIRKRMGYEEVADYQQHIWGVHYYSAEDRYLLHAGTKLYDIGGNKRAGWEYTGQTQYGESTITKDDNALGRYWITDSTDPYDLHNGEVMKDPRPYEITLSGTPIYPMQYELVEQRIITESYMYGTYRNYWQYEYKWPNDGNGNIIKANAAGESGVYYDDTRKFAMGFVDKNNLPLQEVADGLAEHRSVSFELNQKLLILDGTNAWLYDLNGLHSMRDYTDSGEIKNDVAYIPTVTISKDPVGQDSQEGNVSAYPLNLITSAFKDSFYVDENHPSLKVFQMDFAPLDEAPVKAWVMDSQGEMQEKTQDTDFTVDYEEGTITFVTAPGSSPLEGEDNVIIQAHYSPEGYPDRIHHCTIGAMFGVNGAHDRIFISGNPGGGDDGEGNTFTYKNCDWWCEEYDPTYWPDINYSKLGSDMSAIMGYSIINNYLAAHKDYRELTQSVIIREGDLVDDKSVFKIINSLQGAGAVSKYCFSYLATEPVFLTKLGVYAVTAQDVTGEKYAQDRSYYLEGKLLKEPNLENAFAYAWKDYYIVAINDHLYILDGLQPMHTDRSRPYATRQYAGFYFTNIPATCFFEMNDMLYFGSESGKVYRFYKDDTDLASYNDNGDPITAVWETADISEKLFYKKKTYRYLALRCMPAISSSVKVYAQKQGQWELLKDEQSKLKYFTYSQLQYSKLSYSTDKTQKISATKIRLKKLDHVRFKFINDRLNEPLGINDFAVEYTQAGNVK